LFFMNDSIYDESRVLDTYPVIVIGAQILIGNPRDTDHIIKEIIDKKPTSFGNVPTLFLMVQNNPMSKKIPPEVLDNISLYVSGAAPFPPEAIREFAKQFHTENKFVEVYGMTETAIIVTANPMYGEKKIGTVGLPINICAPITITG
ncbi:unnamed protein product, partial [marine sediment metagenome]